MSVPTYDAYMLPMLKMAADGKEHDIHEARDVIAEMMQLTDAQLNEMLSSGRKTKYKDRINWAKTYLTKAGLLERTGRGKFRITARGYDMLNSNPTHLDRYVLSQFPEFVEFNTQPVPPETARRRGRHRRNAETEPTPAPAPDAGTQLQAAYDAYQAQLADDLRHSLMTARFATFQHLLTRLLHAMKYRLANLQPIRLSDTASKTLYITLQEDQLGLGTLYLRASQWTDNQPIQREDVQQFVQHMGEVGHTKGIFVTTGCFDDAAIATASEYPDLTLSLIDGEELVRLLLEQEIGVHTAQTYVVKKIDLDIFP